VTFANQKLTAETEATLIQFLKDIKLSFFDVEAVKGNDGAESPTSDFLQTFV
jgi:hypothetical protein